MQIRRSCMRRSRWRLSFHFDVLRLALRAPAGCRFDLLQRGIVQVAFGAACVEGAAVISIQRSSQIDAAWKVRIGDEEAAEGDGVRIAAQQQGLCICRLVPAGCYEARVACDN
jgi:hypothetical protein